ncbi:MAG: FlgD immunoglobulin-like domain containing protein [Rhodothermales bacterium]
MRTSRAKQEDTTMKCSPSRLDTVFSLVAAALVTVSTTSAVRAQDTLWTVTFGGMEDDYGYAVSQTADGGFILTGETYTRPTAGPSDLWLIKTDADGKTQWERTFGSGLYDRGYSVRQTFEGGYIVAGSMDTPNVSSNVFIVRTDANGDTLWSKTFGNRFTIDSGQSVVQTADSGFAIAGWIRTPTNNDDLYLIRLDTVGTTLWTKLVGGSGRDRAYSVEETAEGGFVLAGETASAGETPAGDIWIVKTDSAGNVEWQKNYGYQSYDVAKSVVQTRDGGYMVAGTIQDGGYDGWLLKTDAMGDTLWAKRFGSIYSDEIDSIEQTSDGGYAFTGQTGMNGDLWVGKTDADGDLDWERSYGGNGLDNGFSIEQTSDGGLVIAAYTSSFGAGKYDAWLLRIGPVSTSIEAETPDVVSGMALYPNYPNPYSMSTRIEYSFEKPTYAQLAIVDIRGRVVRTLVDGFQESGRRAVEWDGTTSAGIRVPSGAYIYRLRSNRETSARMMMVVR